MDKTALLGKTILITGSARRVGRIFALGCAQAGADIVIHHGHSPEEAAETRDQIEALGRRAWVLASDLGKPAEASESISRANRLSPLYALVNSAAIFEPLSLPETTLADWERHLTINLTAPFLLSQAFAQQLPEGAEGRIVNILDWRALRPGADHFPYTISKAALAALTRSLAVALAPRISVNGLALGAVLPPADGGASPDVIKNVPLGRWSEEQEVQQALVFLLAGPAYVTGEIIHVDGGRHLV
jgi:NAD(P)-dependent dehydrogenase (short-subunit alcohol dehydrogenase family)